MRPRVDGNALLIDLIGSVEDVVKVVRLALKSGLPNIGIDHDKNGYSVMIRPVAGAFAAEPLAAMLTIVAEIQGTRAETLIDQWRDRAGDSVTA